MAAQGSDDRIGLMMQMMANLQESMQKQVEKVVNLQKQVQNLQQGQDSMSKGINTFVTPLYRIHFQKMWCRS